MRQAMETRRSRKPAGPVQGAVSVISGFSAPWTRSGSGGDPDRRDEIAPEGL